MAFRSVVAGEPGRSIRRQALLQALGGIGGYPDAAALSGRLQVGNQFAFNV